MVTYKTEKYFSSFFIVQQLYRIGNILAFNVYTGLEHVYP